MKFKKVFIFLLFAYLYPTTVIANDYEQLKLHWTAPKRFTTGDRLYAQKDLKEYKIYYGFNLNISY